MQPGCTEWQQSLGDIPQVCQESWGADLEQDPSQAGFYSIEIHNKWLDDACVFSFLIPKLITAKRGITK